MVLLMWYNSLVLSGNSGVESRLITMKFFTSGVILLNLGDGPAGFSSDEELMEPLGWDNI